MERFVKIWMLLLIAVSLFVVSCGKSIKPTSKNGMYFLKIIMEDGTLQMKKFVRE